MMVEPTCIGFWPEDAGGNVAPDFGAQLVAILVVYCRRAHGHGLVAPVTFNTGISQGSRSSSFVRPASRSERLPKISYSGRGTMAQRIDTYGDFKTSVAEP